MEPKIPDLRGQDPGSGSRNSEIGPENPPLELTIQDLRAEDPQLEPKILNLEAKIQDLGAEIPKLELKIQDLTLKDSDLQRRIQDLSAIGKRESEAPINGGGFSPLLFV